ncbi:18590_t:CDS:2, partial [Racocetra persica]
NTDNWVRVLKEYRSSANLDYNITTILDTMQLEQELIQFFLGLCCKDKEPYSPKSIYNCYYVIVRYLKDNSLMHPCSNLFDETCYGKLIKSLDSKIKKTQDLNSRSADKSDSLSFEEVRHILNHDELRDDSPQALTKRVYFWLCLLCGFRGEKNNARGIKNLDNAGHNLCGIWFVDNSLGRHSHKNMNREICKVTGISIHLRKITNYSLRRTAIQILTELNVATNHIMPFSGHRTLNSVISYQTFTPQVMHNTVSLIIPDCNSSEFNNNDKKEDHNKEYSGNQKENHDKDYGNKEEIHDDGNKNEDANKKTPLPSNVESNSHNSRKKCKVLKTSHDWSKPFKIPYHTSSKQTSPALQESNNKDCNKPLNNSVMPQININNCKNISVDITIKHS